MAGAVSRRVGARVGGRARTRRTTDCRWTRSDCEKMLMKRSLCAAAASAAGLLPGFAVGAAAGTGRAGAPPARVVGVVGDAGEDDAAVAAGAARDAKWGW